MMCLDPGSDSPSPAQAGPNARSLAIQVDVTPERATVVIGGELDLVSMPVLAARLSVVLRRRPRRLILDMAGTTFMDCACTRLLANAGQFFPDYKPVIRQPTSAVRRVLQLTGLDTEFEIEELPGRAGLQCSLRASRE